MNAQKLQYLVIPPEANAEFVANMEEVLDVYEQPYNSDLPVVCMDEQPVQLITEVRTPIDATLSHPKRIDYEYERAGTASIFLFVEPLASWRRVQARERRTKIDWAAEVAELLDTRYKSCEKVIIVCDNLNTHTKGAFYEAFEPQRARAYAQKVQFCHTPKHGSWLNIAENELSAMTRQCLHGRRIGELKTLNDEVEAWSQDVNSTQKGVDWQMRVDDARVELESVYPKVKT